MPLCASVYMCLVVTYWERADLLALDSHEISYLFFRKLDKVSQNLSSAAIVIGVLTLFEDL